MNSMVEIGQAFHAQALTYSQFAKIQFEIGRRLCERLDYLKLKPRFILDLGCGPGTFLQDLQSRYPQAQIVGVDLAEAMLLAAKTSAWRINADMHHLPFKDNQFDLIFSNQVLHWSPALSSLLRECHRVLHTEGCMMFSTLGPDTFAELKCAFQSADDHQHVNEFLDMHHLGDALLTELFDDPVVDMEKMTAHYGSLQALLQSLKKQGVKNIHPQRNPGLTGKRAWQKFTENYAAKGAVDQKYALTYEVVYGHAWKSKRQYGKKGIETRISVDELKASLNAMRENE